MYIERVMDEIKLLGTPDPRKFIPCTEEEVYFLEHQVHLSLPITYKEFLLTMGKEADDFLGGSEFLYQELVLLPHLECEMASMADSGFTETENEFRLMSHCRTDLPN
jgi:hypothetical protein